MRLKYTSKYRRYLFNLEVGEEVNLVNTMFTFNFVGKRRRYRVSWVTRKSLYVYHFRLADIPGRTNYFPSNYPGVLLPEEAEWNANVPLI